MPPPSTIVSSYFSTDVGRAVESFLLAQAVAADVLDVRGVEMIEESAGLRDQGEKDAEGLETEEE